MPTQADYSKIAAALGDKPSFLDLAAPLLSDNASPFSQTSPPLLFQDTPLAGSVPTVDEIMKYWAQRQPNPNAAWIFGDRGI